MIQNAPPAVGSGVVLRSLRGIGHELLARLPYLGVALVVLLVFWALSALLKRGVRGLTLRLGRADAIADVLGRLAAFFLMLLGVAVAAVILFPGFGFGDLIGALGIGSVAVGFAFQDILQNFLAGLLLLWRQPFEVGDQIRSGEHEGAVEEINIRSTHLRTYAGELAVIPNADIFTNAVLVRTDSPRRRVRLDVPVDYGESLEVALEAIERAVRAAEGVLGDPAPFVRVTGVGPAVCVSVFFWTASEQAKVLATTDRVSRGIDRALKEAEVDLAPPAGIEFTNPLETSAGGTGSPENKGGSPVAG